MPGATSDVCIPTFGQADATPPISIHSLQIILGFRKHCVQVHGLNEDDPDSQVFLGLGKWTLKLLKA